MRKTIAGLASLTLLLLTLLTFAQADRATAKSLNTQGYRLYKQAKYDEALRLFRSAVEADPTYGLAHYNLACTIGVICKREPCDDRCYGDEVFNHLEQTLRYLPAKKKKMMVDPDLEDYRSRFRWQMLMGLAATRTADVKKILVNVKWYGPAPGAYGPMNGINFQANDRFRFWAMTFTEEGMPTRVYAGGTYQVSGNRVTLDFDQSNQEHKKHEGSLSPDGVLQFKTGEYPLRFTDDDDRCSA